MVKLLNLYERTLAGRRRDDDCRVQRARLRGGQVPQSVDLPPRPAVVHTLASRYRTDCGTAPFVNVVDVAVDRRQSHLVVLDAAAPGHHRTALYVMNEDGDTTPSCVQCQSRLTAAAAACWCRMADAWFSSTSTTVARLKLSLSSSHSLLNPRP